MVDAAGSSELPKRLLFGFVAGFLATLIFHQLTLSLLWAAGISPFSPFPMGATAPLGVPAVFSLAFWGGVWGVLFALVERAFPSDARYWIILFVLGGILPSLVALIVVLPLKGMPMGGGWSPSLLITAFLINGAWGVGTGLIFKALAKWAGGAQVAAE